MSEPYVGEIRAVGFNFNPVGWAFCNGSVLSIAENSVLFMLIGTAFGGNGQSTFGLPDLRGRVPLHSGAGLTYAQIGGSENVTLTQQQLPNHTHSLMANTAPGGSGFVQNSVLAQASANVYNAITPAPSAAMNANAITTAGGNLPHDNLQPFLVINWIIALYGVFPSQT